MTPKELREFASAEIAHNEEMLDENLNRCHHREELLHKRIEAYEHILATVQDDDDAPITPERLVASGWQVDFDSQFGKYRHEVCILAGNAPYGVCCTYIISQRNGVPYASIAFVDRYTGVEFPEYLTPINMGEVRHLMQRCGIEVKR